MLDRNIKSRLGGILNFLLMICAGLEVLKWKAITLFSFLKKLYSIENG